MDARPDGDLSMNKQILAISLGDAEDEIKRDTLYAWLKEQWCELVDDNQGLFTDGECSFVCTCFEKTQYILFKEHEGELPEYIFQYIFALKDEKQTVISLGDEDEERWEIIKTDSEFTLKRFKKVWLETEDE